MYNAQENGKSDRTETQILIQFVIILTFLSSCVYDIQLFSVIFCSSNIQLNFPIKSPDKSCGVIFVSLLSDNYFNQR